MAPNDNDTVSFPLTWGPKYRESWAVEQIVYATNQSLYNQDVGLRIWIETRRLLSVELPSERSSLNGFLLCFKRKGALQF